MIIKKHLTSLLAPLVVASLLSLSGCVIHKIEVQQGNVVPDEVVGQLKPGMSKRQVVQLLGTPLLHDSFNRDRWDYHFSFKDKLGQRKQKDLVLLFQGDRLTKVAR